MKLIRVLEGPRDLPPPPPDLGCHAVAAAVVTQAVPPHVHCAGAAVAEMGCEGVAGMAADQWVCEHFARVGAGL